MGIFSKISKVAADLRSSRRPLSFRGKRKKAKDHSTQYEDSSALETKTPLLSDKPGSITPHEPIDDATHEPPVDSNKSSDFPSLWDRAYESLKETEPETIDKYEKLLSAYLSSNGKGTCTCLLVNDINLQLGSVKDEAQDNIISQRDQKSRQNQMFTITSLGLQRMDEGRLSAKGRDIILQGRFLEGSGFLMRAKSIIDEAIKASPEASLVWAGICLTLPFFTNPALSQQANETGLVYVISRMKYYTAMEAMLLPEKLSATAELASVKRAYESHIVDLYKFIINFQVQTILRLYRPNLLNFLRDTVLYDDWENMLNAVKETEALIDRESRQINTAFSHEELVSIRRLADESGAVLGDQLKILTDQLKVSESHRDISLEQLELDKKRLQYECHALFRRDDYELFKNYVPDRIDGTCAWFLNYSNYESWKKDEYGPLLVTADPGCGKSVLSKYLVDHEFPKIFSTVCYFFKEDTQNTAKQALCALIHQLLEQKPDLIQHAMKGYERDREKVSETVTSLWDIVDRMVNDPKTDRVVFVIDALDECIDKDRQYLTSKINDLFKSKSHGGFKVLLTGRPYEQVTYGFEELGEVFPTIRVQGEDELSTIQEEANTVIKARVDVFAKMKGLKPSVKTHLQEKLQSFQSKTYLWMYLVFNDLEKRSFKKTDRGIDSVIDNLPATVYDAYEKILEKPSAYGNTGKALLILLGAERLLTVREMQVAMATGPTTTCLDDLDLEDESDFKSRLREMCGLFIIIYEDKVSFLHLKAKEFLLTKQSVTSQPRGLLKWSGQYSMKDAHVMMAELCISFMCLDDFKDDFLGYDESGKKITEWKNENMSPYAYLDQRLTEGPENTFLMYSQSFWCHHVEEAGEVPNTVWELYCNKLCNAETAYCFNFTHIHCTTSDWLKTEIVWRTRPESCQEDTHRIGYDFMCTSPFTKLGYQVALGHLSSVKRSLKEGADINNVADIDEARYKKLLVYLIGSGRSKSYHVVYPKELVSALQVSCFEANLDTTNYLLQMGADPNVGPWNGHKEWLMGSNRWELMMQHGFHPVLALKEFDDLSWVLKIASMDPHRKDKKGRTLLQRYIRDRLEKGHCLNADKYGDFLDLPFDMNVQDNEGKTVLHDCINFYLSLYSDNSHPDHREAMDIYTSITTLLMYGACPSIADNDGVTPFDYILKYWPRMPGLPGIMLQFGVKVRPSEQEARRLLESWRTSPDLQERVSTFIRPRFCSSYNSQWGNYEKIAFKWYMGQVGTSRIRAWLEVLVDRALGNDFNAGVLKKDCSIKVRMCSVCGEKHRRYKLPKVYYTEDWVCSGCRKPHESDVEESESESERAQSSSGKDTLAKD